jgi:SAM-dependent methyltransferase
MEYGMSTAAKAERYGDQHFRHADEGEAARLDALTRSFHDASVARLSALGIGPGRRCLEVGAGTGVVARWLATAVAPGQVDALDRDTGLLDTKGIGNLRVVKADISAAESPDPDGYDLIHSRFLLMHLHDRDAVLAKLVSWLRPGGWLMISDAIDLGTPASPSPALRTALSTLWRLFAEMIGTDLNYGRTAPKRFVAAGLTDVDMALDMPTVSAGSPTAEFLTRDLMIMRPRLAAAGLAADIIDEALRYLAAPDTFDFTIGMVSAWGRRPAD